MIHVAMKFGQIIFSRLEVTVRKRRIVEKDMWHVTILPVKLNNNYVSKLYQKIFCSLKVMGQTSKDLIWHLTSDCDLDLGVRVMIVACDTPLIRARQVKSEWTDGPRHTITRPVYGGCVHLYTIPVQGCMVTAVCPCGVYRAGLWADGE
jgi:hypothetical protein